MTKFFNRPAASALETLSEAGASRRSALRLLGGGAAATAATLLVAGCGGSSSSSSGNQDATIITAAATAEALASTMYYNIISGPLYKASLASNAADQAYLVAGFQEEVIHYNTLVASGGKSLATTFYFPTGMFTDAQTTVNTLITLEDAFIAAYLIGIRDFSSSALKVLAGQIMGVECEHRALGRVVGADLGLASVTGLSGTAESVTPPSGTSNNLAFERTFSATLPNIAAVETALGPFLAAGSTGFSTTGFPIQLALPAGTTPVTLKGTTPTG